MKSTRRQEVQFLWAQRLLAVGLIFAAAAWCLVPGQSDFVHVLIGAAIVMAVLSTDDR